LKNKNNLLDITVSILSYNRPDYLYECIQSVLSQKNQPKKIIVYDNASNEDVYLKIEPLLSCNNIEWVGSEINYGDRWNFNRAVSEINTKFIMILHDDDVLCANFLNDQINFFYKIDNLLALSANGYRIDNASKRLKNFVIDNSNTKSDFLIFDSKLDIVKYTLTSCIPMSPTIYLSEVFRKVSIDDNYKQYIDIILFLDIVRFGKIAINLRPVYECRIHENQGSGYIPIADTDNLYKLYTKIILENQNDLNLISYSYTNYIFSLFYQAILHRKLKRILYIILPFFLKTNFKFKYFIYILYKKIVNKKNK